MPRASAWVAAIAVVMLAAGCGDDPAASPASPASTVPAAPPLASLADWCARARETLPALATPGANGQQLAVLDQHLARASALAAGAPDVPDETTAEAASFAAAIADVRDRVDGGESIADVLQETFADDDSPLVVTGTELDGRITELCG